MIQVFIIFLPAARFLIFPVPPGVLAARFFAAVIRPPLDFFAIINLQPDYYYYFPQSES
jgi:hypothetical protein